MGKKEEEELQNELIEAIALSKIIVKGKTMVGADVCMQFKKAIVITSSYKCSHIILSNKKWRGVLQSVVFSSNSGKIALK